ANATATAAVTGATSARRGSGLIQPKLSREPRWPGAIRAPGHLDVSCQLRPSRPVRRVSTGNVPTSTTVSWKLCVATSAETRTWMLIFWCPSRISEPSPANVTVDPATDPLVGVACTIMLGARPKSPSTKPDRPAIRHWKLPDADPEPSMATFIATWEIDAVPPPDR